MVTMKAPQNFKLIADCVMQGEKVLISCPKNEQAVVNLIVLTEQEYNQLEEIRKKEQKKIAGERFRENLKAMQEKSAAIGNDKMTLEEINEIIAEVRQEKRKRQ